ncbi:hypothetical protein CBS101457_003507 [Exobasidium rhododendri]|nr:hypothetical protein CBS101457_003507 [Exobasidium rhododendri]
MISVDDIISDLSRLSPQQASSSYLTPSTHPLLALGKSLLPSKLQSDEEINAVSFTSSSSPDATLTLLQDALTHLDDSHTPKSQSSALLISSIYLGNARRVIALNQEKEDESDPWSDEQDKVSASGVFDDLHRRVARLQSFNEGYIARIQELRDLVTSSSDNGRSATSIETSQASLSSA